MLFRGNKKPKAFWRNRKVPIQADIRSNNSDLLNHRPSVLSKTALAVGLCGARKKLRSANRISSQPLQRCDGVTVASQIDHIARSQPYIERLLDCSYQLEMGYGVPLSCRAGRYSGDVELRW
jgi:hypothetical protein